MKFPSFFRKSQPEIIEGPEIKLGHKSYIIAPLNFATLKKVTPLLSSFTALGKAPTTQDYDNIVMVIWLALKRNYPNLKLSEVEQNLDLSNINQIASNTMNAGGVKTSGEAKAASL